MSSWLGERGWERWTRLGVAACLAAVVAALWCVPIVPTHDSPKNLYSAHVAWHLGDAAFRDAFQLGDPVTAFGYAVLYGPVEWLLGVRLAHQVVLTLLVLLLPGSLWLLGRAFSPQRGLWLAALGAAVAVHWSVHMGFVNFVGSLGLGFLALATALGSPAWSLRRELAVYGLLVGTCAFHPVGAQFAAIGVALFRVQHSARGRLVRQLGSLFLAITPAFAITLLSHDALEDLRQKGIVVFDKLDLTAAQRAQSFARLFVCGPAWRSWPVLGLSLMGVGMCLLALARRRWDSRATALLAVGAAGLAGALLTPMHTQTWQFAQPRFLPFALLPGLALLPVERLRGRILLVAIGAAVSFAVASNAWVAKTHRDFFRQHPAVFDLVDAPAPGRTFLPILAREELTVAYQQDWSRPVPCSSPLMNIGHLHAAQRAAVVPYTFAFLPRAHLIRWAPMALPPAPKRSYGELFRPGADPAQRSAEVVRLASLASRFDDVMFYGAENDARVFLSWGFEPSVRSDGYFIASFRGCPRTVRFESTTPAMVALGWGGTDRVAQTFAIEAGAHEVPIAQAPCGPIWLDPYDEGGAFDLGCRGAKGEILELPRDAEPSLCVVERRGAARP